MVALGHLVRRVSSSGGTRSMSFGVDASWRKRQRVREAEVVYRRVERGEEGCNEMGMGWVGVGLIIGMECMASFAWLPAKGR